jgi:hypothetical protein
MYKLLAVVMTCCLGLLVFACAGSPAGNSANSANSNAAIITNLDKGNMPPGLSGNTVTVNGAPGIDPANVNINMNVKGATPTPGIDPVNANKVPRGATPTPGIPSPEEIKKMQMQNNKGMQMNINTPPAGNVQRRDEMRQFNKKRPGNN